MNFLKRSAVLILSLFVSLIVSVLVYFIILVLPVFLSDTSVWTNINIETMNWYAFAGAVIVFVVTSQKTYKKLKAEWSDSTQGTTEPESEK